MAHTWHVLVVEDDPDTRGFLERGVQGDPDLCVVGSVGTRADAMRVLDDPGVPVDALLVDLGLPDGSGLEVIARAVDIRPGCDPIVVSVFGDDGHVLAAVEAGAVGYLHKDVRPAQVAEAIRIARGGGSVISPAIARRLLSRMRGDAADAADAADGPDASGSSGASGAPGGAGAEPGRPRLSQREQEVLSLIARGCSYAEVGQRVGVSLHTVQAHIKSLYGKLSVHSKNAAVFEATRLGLLDRPVR